MWQNFRSLICILSILLIGCTSLFITDDKGRVYHCVATATPIPPPDTWAKKTPLEKFEYGDYYLENRPTTGDGVYCNFMQLPKTAFLKYRVDDKTIEKSFDLSKLNPSKVYKKTVEFYVDGETVEVWLLSPRSGVPWDRELILRQ